MKGGEFMFESDRIKIALEESGCENINDYSLINNYGFTFKKKGNRYDLRHWLNVYGASVDFWEIHALDTKESFEGKTLEEALEEIKNI